MEESGWSRHIFCVGTVDANPQRPLLFADLRIATLTDVADTARPGPGLTDNAVSHFPPAYLFSDLCDHSGEFMAQNDRRPVRVTVVIDMEVTSADRYGLHFDQDLILPDFRFRDFSDLNQAFSLAIFYDCFHRISL